MSSIIPKVSKRYCTETSLYGIIIVDKSKGAKYMSSTQIYEKVIKVRSARRTAILISAILSYVLYLAVWVFIGLLNPEKSILIFAGGILSCALIVIITWKYLFLEYEYSFYQGTLTISKIYGKRKIKHVTDADLKKLILIAPATDENIQKAEHLGPDKRIISVSNEYAENIYLLVTGEELEERLLIFIEADERSLSILKSNAPFAFIKNS